MQEFSSLFEGVEDPRSSNATRHSLHKMLMIALLSTLCGGEGCADMKRFGRAKEGFLRRFMVPKHGIPSHDAFSDLFNTLDPGLQQVLLRLLEDWSALLEDDVIAIDGKSLRRSFATAATRSAAATSPPASLAIADSALRPMIVGIAARIAASLTPPPSSRSRRRHAPSRPVPRIPATPRGGRAGG